MTKNKSWGSQFHLGMKRELDPREEKLYQAYCEYCRKLGCEPGSPEMWWLKTYTLPNV